MQKNPVTQTLRTQFKGVAMLLATAFIWGSAFIAQSVGMESIDAFTFNGARSVLAVCALLPVIIIRDLWVRRSQKNEPHEAAGSADNLREKKRRLLRHGLILGLVFFCATNLQQFAFYDSSAGKIAFLTSLYLFFVPLFGLPFGKRISKKMWLFIGIGFISLYFLCIRPGESFSVNRGDLLAFLCAMAFAVQILLIERFSQEDDGLKLAWIQLFVSGSISLVMMFVFEAPSLSAIVAAGVPLLYAGVLSSAAAYSLQIAGQKYTEATLASLLMCMESVFALITAWFVLGEWMTPRELAGCALLLFAVVAATLTNNR